MQSGWQSTSIHVLASGWYTLGFGIGSVAEFTQPSVIAFDNIRFSVPSPSPLGLMVLASLVLTLLQRPKVMRGTKFLTASDDAGGRLRTLAWQQNLGLASLSNWLNSAIGWTSERRAL